MLRHLICWLQDRSYKKLGTEEILRFNPPDIPIMRILDNKCSDERKTEFGAGAGLLDYIGEESISTRFSSIFQDSLRTNCSLTQDIP